MNFQNLDRAVTNLASNKDKDPVREVEAICLKFVQVKKDTRAGMEKETLTGVAKLAGYLLDLSMTTPVHL